MARGVLEFCAIEAYFIINNKLLTNQNILPRLAVIMHSYTKKIIGKVKWQGKEAWLTRSHVCLESTLVVSDDARGRYVTNS